MIRKGIDFEINNDIDKFVVEALCIKVKVNNEDIHLINYYNAPDLKINKDLLNFIDQKFKMYILCGDLNAKHVAFGCNKTNLSGSNLFETVNSSKAVLLNNEDHTFYRTQKHFRSFRFMGLFK